MPRKDSASQATHRKKETTLKEAVVVRIKQFFDLYGLDAAMRKFDEMKVDFAGNQDWPGIDKEVMDFLGEKTGFAGRWRTAAAAGSGMDAGIEQWCKRWAGSLSDWQQCAGALLFGSTNQWRA